MNYAHFVIPALLLSACGPAVQIDKNVERNDIHFRIQKDSCQLALWAPLEPEEPCGISINLDCDLPFSEKLQMTAKLIDALSREKVFPTVERVHLSPFNSNPELSKQLALAALQSSDWDAKKGRPKASSLNEYAENLMNKEEIMNDIIALFEEHGLALKVGYVEKVRVSKVEQTPYFDDLKAAGAKPADHVPIDGMVTLIKIPVTTRKGAQ